MNLKTLLYVANELDKHKFYRESDEIMFKLSAGGFGKLWKPNEWEQKNRMKNVEIPKRHEIVEQLLTDPYVVYDENMIGSLITQINAMGATPDEIEINALLKSKSPKYFVIINKLVNRFGNPDQRNARKQIVQEIQKENKQKQNPNEDINKTLRALKRQIEDAENNIATAKLRSQLDFHIEWWNVFHGRNWVNGGRFRCDIFFTHLAVIN